MKTNNNFHILIVDDEKFNIELAAVYLKEEGYKISFALNAKGALEQAYKKDFQLILLDINMPKVDGFELCSMLKKDKKTKDIPIVFLTAQTDIEYISKAFEVGGVDYLSKPFNSVELKARVKTHLKNVAYLEEIKEKQSKLAQLSITDSFTKLSNSLYFDAQMNAYKKREENFWFLSIHIDRFDKLNKIYGFSNANKIIKTFAKLLKTIVYSNATIARLNGVHFGVLLKEYEKEEIQKLYEKIALALLKEKKIAKLITFSAVLYHVSDTQKTTETLYKEVFNSLETLQEKREKYIFIH